MEASQKPFLIERIVESTSYLTGGLVGFIWLIIGAITKSNSRPFVKYHIFQSIFLSIGFYLLCQILGLILNILSIIPFIGKLLMQITLFFNMPIFWNFSIIQTLIYTFVIYLTITSFQGRFTYVPWVSDIIKMNVRNS